MDVGDEGKDQFWRVLTTGSSWTRTVAPRTTIRTKSYRMVGGGRSDSLLAVIARPGPGFDDQVILKFARPSEVNRWQEAISSCPVKFCAQHLVDMITPGPLTRGENSWWIAVLKIAGGDTSTFRPLVELHPNKGKSFADVCKKIVKSIIADWNPKPWLHSPETASRVACLNEVFDSRRVTPGKPLREWLVMNGISRTEPLIRRSEWPGLVPNPLTFAIAATRIDKDEQRGVLFGRAHGDLHLRNSSCRLIQFGQIFIS